MNRSPGSITIIFAIAVWGVGATNPASAQCQANELAKLTASDAAPSDEFGRSVSIDGDVLVVGAARDDDAGSASGSAYVFRYDSKTGVWNQEAKLTASDAAEDDLFGFSVSVEGDVALIGARSDDDAGSGSGSAYVFRFDGSTWIEEAKLTASDASAGDLYGSGVSVSGDVAVIGALGDVDAGEASGSAYVFRFDGSTWIEEAKLTASNAGEWDFFGYSVSISGDLAVIGARNEGNTGGHDDLSGQGAAYVYRLDGTNWVEEAKLTAIDGAMYDKFGTSVTIRDDVAVIGAYQEVKEATGSAYVFRFDPQISEWIEEAKLTASDAAAGDRFGISVSLSGDVVVIGAMFGDARGAQNSGSAYVFGGLSDCNENGTLDLCDIANGTSTDANENGIPDECECPWDLDGSGSVGASDLLALLASWGPCKGCPADFDGDGNVGASDLLTLLANWGPCPK